MKHKSLGEKKIKTGCNQLLFLLIPLQFELSFLIQNSSLTARTIGSLLHTFSRMVTAMSETLWLGPLKWAPTALSRLGPVFPSVPVSLGDMGLRNHFGNIFWWPLYCPSISLQRWRHCLFTKMPFYNKSDLTFVTIEHRSSSNASQDLNFVP